MRPQRLTAAELDTLQATLPAWTVRGDRLYRALRFHSFAQAFGFMTTMAFVSEAMNHHPEWRNVYRDLVIELVTHDAGGITSLDVEWALRADAELAARASA